MAISRSQLIYSKYLETLANYHTYPINGPVKMFKMCLKLLSTVVQNLTKLLANVALKFQSNALIMFAVKTFLQMH